MKNPFSKVYLWAIVGILLALMAYAWFPIPTSPTASADKVLVLKSERTMVLFHSGKEICSYQIALGRDPHGPKTREGDHKTPEGNYVLDHKNFRSGFHLSMHVSYPNESDRDRASREGDVPGGLIMVHGIKNGLGWLGRLHRLVDWTDGCIAITNAEMDQFAELVPEGTPIEIQP